MKQFDHPSSDPNLSRRSVMAFAAQSLLGVSCAGMLGQRSIGSLALAAEDPQIVGKAKSVIYLFMTGGMSHLDSFDPKPGAKSQGETKPTATKIPGVSITDRMPKIADLMNGIALIRSMTTQTGAHEQGQYMMRTSFKPLNSIRHPGMGAWAASVLGKNNQHLPPNVAIGGLAEHPGSGFLPATVAPVPIGNPAEGLQNTESPSYLQEDQFKKRMSLSNQFDVDFKRKHKSQLIDAYDATYREAVKLMGSSELKVFNIANEKEEVREKYGNNRLGQGLLLARRLVEKGVRFVEVEYGNWDHHNDLCNRAPDMLRTLDQALSALLLDLRDKGLISQTLVVLTTEFGRTPILNENAGRDHHPGAFSALLCGAGIKGGLVYGATDTLGQKVDSDPVYPEDLNATIATTLGLPLEKEFIAPNGRPFRIADRGTPVKKILA